MTERINCGTNCQYGDCWSCCKLEDGHDGSCICDMHEVEYNKHLAERALFHAAIRWNEMRSHLDEPSKELSAAIERLIALEKDWLTLLEKYR